MEKTTENLEQIEHHHHAAHAGGFDRKVAVTMAIIAALLATVTMLGHRAHNHTLQLLGDATRLQAEANILHTQATDQWGFYQAKNVRSHEYATLAALLASLSEQSVDKTKRDALARDWQAKVQKYESKDLREIEAKANQLTHEGEVKEHQAAEKVTESDHEHHRGNWFDLAELAVEIGLVLCSLAVLSKRSPFWFAGMLAAGIGIMIAFVAVIIH